VLEHGQELYRNFAWRRTQKPYEILVSEVMLQQTQVVRVERFYERWLRQFPTLDALAAAGTGDVLAAWQGLGYNRRALALKRLADEVSEGLGGVLPDTREELLALPGVGPATAAGVLIFAYDLPETYLETNVRAVILHELFPEDDEISDRRVLSEVRAAAECVHELGVSARVWNYALLDYGAWLKKALPNPSRRSKHYGRQSPYEGSRRQKRARLLEAVLASDGDGSSSSGGVGGGSEGLTTADLAAECGLPVEVAEDVLTDLAREGFVAGDNGRWRVAP